MKSKWLTLSFFTLLIAVLSMSLIETTEAAKAKTKTGKLGMEKQKSCSACHDERTSVLPKNHSPVNGNTLDVCWECHAPEQWGMTEPDKFDTHIHLVHLKNPRKADCPDCHTWQPGKSFGLAGTAASYGAPSEEDMAQIKSMFASAIESDHLDARHFSKGIGCAACHGKDIPGGGDVENTTCMGCHGSMADLVAKTAPVDFPDRNPHKSHLGEISCTVCHAGHAKSKIYCLECHPKFEIKFK